MKLCSKILFLLLTMPVFATPRVFGSEGHIHTHNHSQMPTDNNFPGNIILKEMDIHQFLQTFPHIEKELAAVNSGIHDTMENVKKHVKQSKTIHAILQKEGLSPEKYLKIFISVMDAYNEVKMVQFEKRIKQGRHEKFKPREKLMIDHEGENHESLHELQKKNFEEKFPEEYLGSSQQEPVENRTLVEKYEKQLDGLFKN